MSRKITCTPPFISSCCCASDLHLLHTNTHIHKSNWDPSAFPFSSFIFFCERCLTGCINANTEEGLREGATKRVRLEKRDTKRNEWIGGRKRRCMHREQDRARQREMKRAGVLFIQLPLYRSCLWKTETLRRNEKGGYASPNHSLCTNAFHSFITILINVFLFFMTL